MSGPGDERGYVSRGGLKLEHALSAFGLSVVGVTAADFGCSTGGFTDCLLRHGAGQVVALDTGYGVIDYRLRTHPKVIVRERTNALHAEPRDDAERPEVVVIDMGWTPQRLCVPAAWRWLSRAGERGRVVTLVKPHYEDQALARRSGGVLRDEDAQRVAETVREQMPSLGARVLGWTRSPIRGGSGPRANLEWLALLGPAAADAER